MLVLSRLVDEEICIGHDVRVRIVEVRGGKVRLGITAPQETPIHRAEIYARIYDSKDDNYELGGES